MSGSIEEGLQKNGFIVQSFEGDSMMPMLDQTHDLVKITALSVGQAHTLQKCDLPLYRRPSGQYVLHRIIGVRKKYVITCGDNRSSAEKVPYEWIIGIAEGYYRDGEYISCSDEAYLRYARKRCRGRILRCMIFRFRPMRGVRRVVRKVRSGLKKLFRPSKEKK
jgi:hypothetical protein